MMTPKMLSYNEVWDRVSNVGLPQMLGAGDFIFNALMAEQPKVCVEIGVNQARSSCLIGLTIQQWGGKLYSFDPYNNITEQDKADLSGNSTDQQYMKALKNLDSFGLLGTVTLIRMFSEEGSKFFEDNSVDFIYIDGGHDDESIRIDCESWNPKLKIGSTIIFDDSYLPAISREAGKFWTGVSSVATQVMYRKDR